MFHLAFKGFVRDRGTILTAHKVAYEPESEDQTSESSRPYLERPTVEDNCMGSSHCLKSMLEAGRECNCEGEAAGRVKSSGITSRVVISILILFTPKRINTRTCNCAGCAYALPGSCSATARFSR